ncbi:hypothetical protein PUN28_008069 [Cardiocondyla obscurior]|uniref:Tetra-peptide repeat homeobox protein 1-like n=1 Tax=Cardiocondyla obscurior TaxID=286306 RepID=A0AAW2FXP2_9HYME
MSKILLFLILICTFALASVPPEPKQQKRSIVGNDGWIGLPSPYGHGQPWATPWKGLKLPEINLHAGLQLAGTTYGRGDIALTSDILKAVPVYITKHVVLEKPVPVPHPVIIEKPYHVPLPIEKIVHKPVPIPIPVPQVVPIPVDHPVPIPVKQPVPVPVQQPIPVPIKHPVPLPIPVPVPVPLHPLPAPALPLHPLPPPALPLIPADGLAAAIYARDHAPDLYPIHTLPVALHLDNGIAAAAPLTLGTHGVAVTAPLALGARGLGHGLENVH